MVSQWNFLQTRCQKHPWGKMCEAYFLFLSKGLESEEVVSFLRRKGDFGLFTEEDLKYIEKQADYWAANSEYAMVGNFGGGGFGDIAAVPGHFLKKVGGVRRMDDWMMLHLLHPERRILFTRVISLLDFN